MSRKAIAQLQALFRLVAMICDEIGLPCLAQRFSREYRIPGVVCCDTCYCEECRVIYIHMVAKLAPLTEALDQSGYHDLALITTELALRFEPTTDLELDHAYLNMLLGENQDAINIYSKVLHRRGSIPDADLQRLSNMAKTHRSEDDIALLHQELRRYTCVAQSPRM